MKQLRSFKSLPYLAPFALLFVVLVLIFPRTPKFNFEYKKGAPWKYETLIAQFDFPVLKTDEQIQEERSGSSGQIVPYYSFSQEIADRNIAAVSGLDFGRFESLRPQVEKEISRLYASGIASDEGVRVDRKTDLSDELLYIVRGKSASRYPSSEVLKQSEARARMLSDLAKTYKKDNLDSILRRSGSYDLLIPNLVYDKELTELAGSETVKSVSPTSGFINAGQMIIAKDELVTASTERILDSYRAEYEASMGYNGSRFVTWLGNIVIALVLLLILWAVIFFSNAKILSDKSRLVYLLFVFLLATVAALGVDKLDSNYLFMVPFPLVALWLVAFFPNRVVIPVYIVTLLPLLVFAHSGSELFVMSLLAGLAAVYAFSFFNRGWEQFLVSLFIFVSLLISYCGFRGIDALNGSFAQHVLFLFISSLLSVVGYSLIFLFEKMFNLVSTSRLQELCDTDNPLLSELEEKAPGTYQHSLQVMAMADAAARSIGANSLLVRAGALYHDVGKMVNPPCFIENETLVPESQRGDYHKDLTPQESARDIINHVKDGMEIAARYKLPHVVRDFIITHHGTSRMNYFYNKYVNEGGDPAQVADFLYDGRKPVTKEQVVLMLCDGVEAASRTLKSNTPEAYSQLVETIASQKTSEGQLDEADISLKELGVVKETIKTYLAQLYHERVPYPKRRVR